MYSNKKAIRIGPKMALVLYMANRPGGVAIIDAARNAGPHGSLHYGYRTVDRVIKTRLVVVGHAQKSGRRGRLICTL